MMFGSKVGFSGSADLMVQRSNFKNPRWRLTAISDTCVYKNGHNFATGLPIDVMFGCTVGFRLSLVFYHRGLHIHAELSRVTLALAGLSFTISGD